MVCTDSGVTFSLQFDGAGYRWLYPDGTITPVWGETETLARRAMMFRSGQLARIFLERHLPTGVS